LPALADKAAADAAAVLRNGRRALRRIADGRVRGRLRRALDEPADTIERTGRVVTQARTRLSGRTPDGATRPVNLHDPHTPQIRKGRIDRPVEFGYKARVVDNDDGVVLDHTVQAGADAPQLAPAVNRIHRRTRRPPRTVTADRGHGAASVEPDPQDLGVRTVAIPRKAKPAGPAARSSTAAASEDTSSGAPDRKDPSATSNASTAGTAAASTAGTAQPSGADTGSSPTT
jgi:transposase, IS5 family